MVVLKRWSAFVDGKSHRTLYHVIQSSVLHQQKQFPIVSIILVEVTPTLVLKYAYTCTQQDTITQAANYHHWCPLLKKTPDKRIERRLPL